MVENCQDELEHVDSDLVKDDNECLVTSDSENTSMSLNEVVCVVAAEKYAVKERRCKLSAGRHSDMRARYWSYLFDNLHRAVDEIYCTCETDESIVECEVHERVSFYYYYSLAIVVAKGGVRLLTSLIIINYYYIILTLKHHY